MSDVFLPVPAEGTAPPPYFRVLIVCTANLYRSPLAECLLRERLAAAREVVQVSSAGTHAAPGGPMAAEAASVLAGWGGDPSGAVSRRLIAELVERADLVLGAAAEHREAAVRLSPVRALSRAFTLREFARLLRAEDAADATAPVTRLTSLVRGAAGRRGTERVQGGDDDVADPLGADVRSARQCALRIEESVNTIAAAMRAGCSPAISSQQRGRRHPSAR